MRTSGRDNSTAQHRVRSAEQEANGARQGDLRSFRRCTTRTRTHGSQEKDCMKEFRPRERYSRAQRLLDVNCRLARNSSSNLSLSGYCSRFTSNRTDTETMQASGNVEPSTYGAEIEHGNVDGAMAPVCSVPALPFTKSCHMNDLVNSST